MSPNQERVNQIMEKARQEAVRLERHTVQPCSSPESPESPGEARGIEYYRAQDMAHVILDAPTGEREAVYHGSHTPLDAAMALATKIATAASTTTRAQRHGNHWLHQLPNGRTEWRAYPPREAYRSSPLAQAAPVKENKRPNTPKSTALGLAGAAEAPPVKQDYRYPRALNFSFLVKKNFLQQNLMAQNHRNQTN
jgi:hypothetical protein